MSRWGSITLRTRSRSDVDQRTRLLSSRSGFDEVLADEPYLARDGKGSAKCIHMTRKNRDTPIHEILAVERQEERLIRVAGIGRQSRAAMPEWTSGPP